MTKMQHRRALLRARCKKLGLYVREYAPDGKEVHMRIFDDPKADYFQGNELYTARTIYRAEAFILGYTAGKGLPKWK